MPPLITFDEALALGELDRPRRDRGAGRARLGGAQRALRRLDRHVLAGQRQVGRLRRGLRLLRPVALRRGRHADARDDGARADPRAREGGRGRRRPPLLHGHPGPGALEARLREDPRGRPAGRRADQPEALRLDRPHVGRARQAARARPASSASTTTSRRRAPTTPRSRPRSATRAGMRTIDAVKEAGLETCVGGILNLGETPAPAGRDGVRARRDQPDLGADQPAQPARRDQVRRPRADGPLGGRQVGGDLPPDPPRTRCSASAAGGSRTSASCSRWRSRRASTG